MTPGGTSVVESSWSITPGPSIATPGGQVVARGRPASTRWPTPSNVHGAAARAGRRPAAAVRRVAGELGLRRHADGLQLRAGRSRRGAPSRRYEYSRSCSSWKRASAACSELSGRSDRHRQRAPLAQVAHGDRCAGGSSAASGTPSCGSRSRPSRLELLELRLDRARVGRRRRACRYISARSWRMSTSRQPSADVMPGFGGTSTVGMDELAGQRGAVQRPGAAEDDEREVARVVAAADRDQAHGVGHVGVGDLRTALAACSSAEVERLGDALGIARSAAGRVELHARRPAWCRGGPARRWRRCWSAASRRGRSRPGRGRRPPTAARCAASRPRRSRPASRRPRRSSAPRSRGSRSGSRTRRTTPS